jgi:hypothetical protein
MKPLVTCLALSHVYEDPLCNFDRQRARRDDDNKTRNRSLIEVTFYAGDLDLVA